MRSLNLYASSPCDWPVLDLPKVRVRGCRSKDEDTMMLIVADLIPPRECPALDGRVFEVDLQSEAGDFD